MAQSPSVTSTERLDLAGRPSERRSTEEFLESFDINTVPTLTGCYIMFDEKDHPIYVGKANNLRARIRTYITERDTRYRVKFLMQQVARFEFLITATEKEALLLENSLIKQYRPRYNVRLRDDKTYVSLRLNPKEDFPRVTVVRRYKKDGAKYFGPYSSSQSVREALKFIHKLFPLRRCSDHVMNNRTRPCLYHQMNQCLAPCVGLVTPELYRDMVEQVILALEGRNTDLEKLLTDQIAQQSDKLEFEKAAVLRDRLYALQRTVERQRTVGAPGAEDRDIFGFYGEGRFIIVQAIFFRHGKLLGGRTFPFGHCEMPIEELLGSLLLQYYSEAPDIPPEILLPIELEDADTLAELLSEQRGTKVAVLTPQRGEKHALVEIAMRNAKSGFEERRLAEAANKDLLEQTQRALKLPKPPVRIECFDISTIQGEKPVGSMVTFEGGVANKARYRHFAIRNVEGQDDFGMMREVLLRRFKRALEEDDLPDLVVIDGGKGQLNVALAVFKDLGIEDLPSVGMAKSRAEDGGHSPERFFLPGRKDPIVPAQHSSVVHLMARVRDEAHRFAVTYHRKRRSKGTLRTSLTDIPGIGEKRARILLNSFGSLVKIRACGVEDIAALPGFNETLARTIVERLSGRAVENQIAEEEA